MKRSIARIVSNFVFEMLSEIFQEEITEQYIKERFIELVGHLQNVMKALLDRNGNNKEQLQEIWQKARPGLVSWGLKEAKEEIDKRVKDPVKQDRLKKYLTEIAQELNGDDKIKI